MLQANGSEAQGHVYDAGVQEHAHSLVALVVSRCVMVGGGL